MPVKKNLLYDQLISLRNELRNRLLLENEKKTICTEEALREMSIKKPSRLSDFLAIPGLDKDFLEQYAHLFLDVILESIKEDVKPVRFSKEAGIALDRYKDRLTDISKSNPNLYMGRIDKVRSFDLYDETKIEELQNFLSLKKSTLKFDALNESVFEHLTTLYRNLNKDYKDLGIYHLYVGYPYVEGIYKKEEFPIKAPLVYFPVRLERSKKTYTLSFDKTKDIVFNRDLLLTVAKLDKSSLPTVFPEIFDLSVNTLKNVIIPFYQANGLELKLHEKEPFIPYKNELKDQFLKSKKYHFVLKPYITFGRYFLYSSMIQKDMADIIESNSYNELLEGLIDETNLYDQEKSLSIEVASEDADEYGLIYINDMNFSQEKVLELIDKEKKIVIWGPPGTGKSQTITSLIAHQILKNENVLVVSEKKVALDVIYHRLGNASRYAMFIDDASAKLIFYDQLKRLIHQIPPVRLHNNDIYQIEEEIKELDLQFNQAINLLYKTKRQNKPIAYFYERYIKDKDILQNLTPKKVYHVMNKYLSNPSFDDIEALEKTFDKDKKIKEFLAYHQTLQSYPWFSKIETKIVRSSLIDLSTFETDIESFKQHYAKAWFFKKRKLKKAFLTNQSMKLSFITTKKSIDKKLLSALMFDESFYRFFIEDIKNLNKIKTNYLKLTKLELSFLSMLHKDDIFKSIELNEKLRIYLFDAYISGFLEEYQANNQKYLYIIHQYEKKMNELKALMEEKLCVAKESFEMALFKHAFDFNNTKRIMDIKRLLESDKLPSVKSFFELFYPELFTHIKVWLLTPEALSSIIPLKLNLFDLVIFDEASQMYVEKGIPAIYRAKKVVIAGDPKQLRPSSLGMGRLDEEDLFDEDEVLKNVTFDAKSLLDLARYRYKESILNYHYRSQYQELIEFSNHAFYEGKLIISPNVLTPKTQPITYVYVKDGTFLKRSNIEESKTVIKILKQVLLEKEENDSVGIITFNSNQRDLILNEIDTELFKTGVHQKRLEKEVYRTSSESDQSLFVKNIENVQGDERDIIIFSMGYAKDDTGSVKRRFGWLNHEGGQNRLNVAITRARKKIYFVSSLYPEELKVDDLSGKGPKLLKDFMRYCFYVSSGNHELTVEVLRSLYQKESITASNLSNQMTSDILQRLLKLGYETTANIGIGQFKIDLAIFDSETQKYKLGIICDLYVDQDTTARKELLHQEKFLKSRGWTIYRIFHMNWYEDPNKILKEIKEIIKTN